MKRKDGFKRGSGVFNCPYCGRRTRETNETWGLGMCGECYEIAGIYNSFQDGEITEAEYTEQIAPLVASIEKKGGHHVD